jgi:hypothetical protein
MLSLSIMVAIRAMAVARITEVIHRRDFPYRLDTEMSECIHLRIMATPVSILDTVAITKAWDTVDISPMAATCIIRGTIRLIWTTMHRHWFRTVVTSIMFQAITTYIVLATGTVTTINFVDGHCLLMRRQQAIHWQAK